jgi:hypothetical protein
MRDSLEMIETVKVKRIRDSLEIVGTAEGLRIDAIRSKRIRVSS